MFTLFENGNRPSINDSKWELLQKIAAILYTLSEGIQPPPELSDPEKTLLLKITGYLQPGGSGITAGGGPLDAYRIQGGIFQIYNPDTGLFYGLSVAGTVGNEQLVIGQGQS